MNQILFFDPYANVWQHSIPIRTIAAKLELKGSLIKLIDCNGLVKTTCIPMDEMKLNFDSPKISKEIVCNSCQRKSKFISNKLDLECISIDRYFDLTQENKRIENLISSISTTNWHEFKINGINIGKFAAYEFILKYKLDSKTIPKDLFPEYLENLRNCLRIYFSFNNLLSANQDFDTLVVYNDFYSLNRIASMVFKKEGKKVFSIQGGVQQIGGTSISIYKSNKDIIELSRIANELIFENKIRLSEAGLEVMLRNFEQLRLGTKAHAYSSPKSSTSIFENFPELKDFSTVALVVLSSEDEYFAAQMIEGLPEIFNERVLFKSQVDWIDFLVDLANKNRDIAFIFRLHPRMFPNKRESVLAPQVETLLSRFNNASRNVFIDVPNLKISIYDYMKIVEIVLPRTSSVGAEFASFGKKVVLPGDGNLFAYPSTLGFIAKNKDDYKKLILKKMSNTEREEKISNAFKWYSFLFSCCSIQITPQPKLEISRLRPKKNIFVLKLWNLATFIYVQFGPRSREKSYLSKFNNKNLDFEPVFRVIEGNFDGLHEVIEPPKLQNEKKIIKKYSNLIQKLI